MLAADLTHQGHDEQVMVVCQVTFFKDRSQFKLVGCYFVVACFYRDTQFKRFYFEIFHKSRYTGRNGTEVVIFQLLILSTVMPHECTSCHQQIGAGGIKTFVYQEIFLFPSQIGDYLLYLRVEITAYIDSCFIYGSQGF